MNPKSMCEECGTELPANAPEGLCPRCLGNMGLGLLASAASPESPFPIERAGTRIGRYKLLEKIGEGGFGMVFMAEQVEPVQRKVALKIIKAGMDTREVIARFEAERQAIALMDHPNIARALDAGATAAGRPYFVMELVRGIPITDYCDQANLPTRERLRLFIKVCQAVQHAHQKGIIHRDLKPSNVLVTEHDGEPVPKVIDFGVAKALGQKLTAKTLFTAFNHMIGTPAYMSPEQAALSGLDIDTRADIYSLGVLLYELLTGVTPFDVDTFREVAMDEIRRMIRETEPPKPSTRLLTLGAKLNEVAKQRQTEATSLSRLLRGDLDWIVMKCLEKDRQRRYETANGLAMDVVRHLQSEPVVARAPGNLYRFQKLVQRHKLGFATAGAVAASLIIGLGSFTWQWRQAVVARQEVARALERAEQSLALMEIQKAEELFGATDTSAALAYLARVLRRTPTNEFVAARVFSNLTHHVLIVPLTEPLSHTGAVYFAQFSPDTRRVVTASRDGTAQVWDANTGRPVTPPLRHQGPVWFAQFSPDSERVVTASEDKTAQVWDANTGQPLTPPLEHSNSVGYVYFSPDGERLVTGTWEPDWAMRIWDAKSGQPLTRPILDVHRLRCPPFSPDGRQLVTTWKSDSAMIWDAKTVAQLAGPFTHDSFVWTAEFSPDGQRIVTASRDGTVRIWGVDNPQQAIHKLPHGKSLWLARFSPDGGRVFTVCNDLTTQVWDSNTGRALTGPLAYAKGADLRNYAVQIGSYRQERTAQFSPNGQLLVMAFGSRPLLLDANTGLVVTEPFRHELARSAEFSRDSERVVTASLDGTARVWGIRDGRQWVMAFRNQASKVPPVCSPVPDLIPQLLEALAERRLNDQGLVETVASAQVQALRRQLTESPGADVWAQWGKWLFGGPTQTNSFR